MPRGVYDRSKSKPRSDRKVINVDDHPGAKHGAAQHVEDVVRIKVLPLPPIPPTLYVKVELPDLNGMSVDEHIEWLKEVKDKLEEQGSVREFVVTNMPSHMRLN